MILELELLVLLARLVVVFSGLALPLAALLRSVLRYHVRKILLRQVRLEIQTDGLNSSSTQRRYWADIKHNTLFPIIAY